jgi:hypothetical protein
MKRVILALTILSQLNCLAGNSKIAIDQVSDILTVQENILTSQDALKSIFLSSAVKSSDRIIITIKNDEAKGLIKNIQLIDGSIIDF